MQIFQHQYCLVCDTVIVEAMNWHQFFIGTEGNSLCKKCRKQFVKLEGEKCQICSQPMKKIIEKYRKGGICYDCYRWEKSRKWSGILTKNFSLYEYNEFLAEVIARFKYRGDYKIARIFSEEIKKAVKQVQYDLVLPIPLSKERLCERGFNQSEALANEAGLSPVQVLTRIHSEKQSKKSREKRIHLPEVFQVTDQKMVRGKTILLIDDIYTTGSTIRHAAYVLKKAGAEKIFSLTMARS